MKLIVATIRVDALETIQRELHEPNAYVMYVSQVGDLRDSLLGSYRGNTYCQPRPRLRLEIVVLNDLMVEDAIDIIVQAASDAPPERASNGSIFVMPLEQWIPVPADRSSPIVDSNASVYSTRGAW